MGVRAYRDKLAESTARKEAVVAYAATLGRPFTIDDLHPHLARFGMRSQFETAIATLTKEGRLEVASRRGNWTRQTYRVAQVGGERKVG